MAFETDSVFILLLIFEVVINIVDGFMLLSCTAFACYDVASNMSSVVDCIQL